MLEDHGIRVAGYISGREPGQQRQAPLPAKVDIVILFTDFLDIT